MIWTTIEAGDARLAPAPGDLALAVAQLRSARLLPECEPRRATVLALADEHPDLLERACRPPHLTGSAAVVDPSTDRALLMHHRKLGRWFQPGGHADGDGNLAGVAWREATEETGMPGLSIITPAIDLDVHWVDLPDGQHLHLDLRFLVLAPAGAVPEGNHESLALRWVDRTSLPAVDPDPSTTRLVHRGLELVARIGSRSAGAGPDR